MSRVRPAHLNPPLNHNRSRVAHEPNSAEACHDERPTTVLCCMRFSRAVPRGSADIGRHAGPATPLQPRANRAALAATHCPPTTLKEITGIIAGDRRLAPVPCLRLPVGTISGACQLDVSFSH